MWAGAEVRNVTLQQRKRAAIRFFVFPHQKNIYVLFFPTYSEPTCERTMNKSRGGGFLWLTSVGECTVPKLGSRTCSSWVPSLPSNTSCGRTRCPGGQPKRRGAAGYWPRSPGRQVLPQIVYIPPTQQSLQNSTWTIASIVCITTTDIGEMFGVAVTTKVTAYFSGLSVRGWESWRSVSQYSSGNVRGRGTNSFNKDIYSCLLAAIQPCCYLFLCCDSIHMYGR